MGGVGAVQWPLARMSACSLYEYSSFILGPGRTEPHVNHTVAMEAMPTATAPRLASHRPTSSRTCSADGSQRGVTIAQHSASVTKATPITRRDQRFQQHPLRADLAFEESRSWMPTRNSGPPALKAPRNFDARRSETRVRSTAKTWLRGRASHTIPTETDSVSLTTNTRTPRWKRFPYRPRISIRAPAVFDVHMRG